MSTNILLTGGRAPVTLELARLLDSAGHHIFVAESLEHHLCQYSRSVVRSFRVPPPRQNSAEYISALAEIIKRENINFLIPTCEEIFYIAKGLDQLKPLCHVFCESLDKLHSLHNKWQFIQLVDQLSLPTPKTQLLTSQQDLQNALNPFFRQGELEELKAPTSLSPLFQGGLGESTFSQPRKIVLKPVYSRFASQVVIISSADAASSQPSLTKTGQNQDIKRVSINELSSLNINEQNPWLAQEFIPGRQYCTYSIAHQGQLKAHATYATTFTAGSGSCIYFESANHPAIFGWVQTLVRSLEFTGQIAFDFIETSAGKLYPLECNPRATSGIHLFHSADHLEQAFFNQTDNIILPQSQHKSMVALAMLLYGLPSAVLSQKIYQWTADFLTARDVVWSFTDLLPFIHQNMILQEFYQLSQLHKISMIEATTLDVEWNGEL